MESEITQLYYKARMTCIQMCQDRGYTVNPSLEHTESSADLSIMAGIKDKHSMPVYILVHPNVSERKRLFDEIAHRTHISNSEEKNVKESISDVRVINIYDSRLIGNRKLEEDYIGHQFIEMFDVRHMAINPVRHSLQPQFRLLSETEIDEVLKRYGTTNRLILGSICIDDPVNKYYGGKPDGVNGKSDVYEITRDGLNVFYRKVVSKRMNLKH
jgi:DNA-directed RNA polymerase subunit H (RpoH/RPB5)